MWNLKDAANENDGKAAGSHIQRTSQWSPVGRGKIQRTSQWPPVGRGEIQRTSQWEGEQASGHQWGEGEGQIGAGVKLRAIRYKISNMGFIITTNVD